jgi:hypothetical protein
MKGQKSLHSNLSFADAKKVWMREWHESQQEHEYSFSSFDEDLERSFRQTLVSSTSSKNCALSSSTTAVMLEEDEETVKQVRFSTITIQEYPIIPGCHPGVSCGIPLTIDWQPYSPVSIDLECYETWRVPNRRARAEMRIPPQHREQILRSLGFTTNILRAATKDATVVRNQRNKSNSIERKDKTSELLEVTIRGIKNLLTLGKKKRKERAFLARHVRSYDGGRRRVSTPPESSKTGATSSSFADSTRRASAPSENLGA